MEQFGLTYECHTHRHTAVSGCDHSFIFRSWKPQRLVSQLSFFLLHARCSQTCWWQQQQQRQRCSPSPSASVPPTLFLFSPFYIFHQFCSLTLNTSLLTPPLLHISYLVGGVFFNVAVISFFSLISFTNWLFSPFLFQLCHIILSPSSAAVSEMSWAHLPLVKSWKKRPGLKKRETEKMRYNTPGPRPLRVHHKLDRESERPSPAELLFLILLWCTGRSGEWCTWGRGWDTKGFRAALAAEVRNQTCSTWKTNRHKNMSKIKADLFNVPSNCLFATWLQVGHSSTEGFKKKEMGSKWGRVRRNAHALNPMICSQTASVALFNAGTMSTLSRS